MYQRGSAELLDYSVIIPSRARRDMLLAALESVFAQTLPPSEVIVVLDGDPSTTSTLRCDAVTTDVDR